jgi:N-acyl-D-aspartate/D-glutamate deacylase
MTPKLLPREASARGYRWSTYAEYNALLERVGLAVNVVHNVGAAQVREAVMGDQDREPTSAELERM